MRVLLTPRAYHEKLAVRAVMVVDLDYDCDRIATENDESPELQDGNPSILPMYLYARFNRGTERNGDSPLRAGELSRFDAARAGFSQYQHDVGGDDPLVRHCGLSSIFLW